MTWGAAKTALFRWMSRDTRKLTKRFIDRQVGLYQMHGCSCDIDVIKQMTTSLVQHLIDSTQCSFRTLESKTVLDVKTPRHKSGWWGCLNRSCALSFVTPTEILNQLRYTTYNSHATYLDLHQVDRLHNFGLGRELTCVQSSACRWNNLTTTTVNSISVKGHVVDIKANGAHVLFTQNTLEITFTQI